MWDDDNLTVFTDIFSSVTSSADSASEMVDSENSNRAVNETAELLSPYGKYCENLQEIGSTYNKIHGIASITVCIFGTLANILNFLILTRKEMVNSTNTILTGLAISDLLNLVEYVPYVIYTDFIPDSVDGGPRKTYPWAIYVLIHSNFSQVCHTISIWLTVTIAAWRYFMISMPLQSRVLCSMRRAKLMIVSAYCITPILCLPIYFTFSVQTVLLMNNTTFETMKYASADTYGLFYNLTRMSSSLPSSSKLLSPAVQRFKYVVNLSNLSNKYPNLVKVNFWIYSVVLKIIPCILLTVVSFCLINSLVKAKRRKEMLLGPLSSSVAVSSSSKSNNPPGFPSIPLPRIPTAFPSSSSAIFTNDDDDTSHNETSTTTAAAPTSNEIPLQVLGPSRQEPLPMQDLAVRHSLSVEISPNTSEYIATTASNRPSSTTSTGDMYLTSRTTRMLLTVLILFLITEFPQGILALLSAIIGQEFFKRCYIPLANLMDFLALVNCSINFILYCFMSKRFRDAFIDMLRGRLH